MTNEVDEAVRVRCHARSPVSAHLCIAPQQLALATGQDAGVTRSGLGCQRQDSTWSKTTTVVNSFAANHWYGHWLDILPLVMVRMTYAYSLDH